MKIRSRGASLWLPLVLVLGLLLAACSSDDGSEVAAPDASEEPTSTPDEESTSSEMDTAEPAVTGDPVSLIFVKSGTMTPVTAADASIPVVMGYWEEENIRVEQPVASGSNESVQGIDAGTFEVSSMGTGAILGPVASGLPVKVIATYVNKNIWNPYVPADSPIQEVADFEGMTIGVPSLESGTVPMFAALLGTVGLTLDDVELVAAGTGSEVVGLLEAGRIDAYAGASSHTALIRPVMDVRPITNEAFTNIGFHVAIGVHEDVLAEKRDALVGLLRGIFKGIVFANANPEVAVAMHYNQYPDTMPTGQTPEEIIENGVFSLGVRLEEFEQVDGLWGNTNPDVHIRSHLEVLVDQERIELEESEIDAFIDDLWDPSLLEEANDFDAEAVADEARALDWRDYMPAA